MSRLLLVLIAVLAFAWPSAAARGAVCPSGAAHPDYCEAASVICGTVGSDLLRGTAGRDTVRADERDELAASCERVEQG
jgi:hypothetical protein